jgi:hypothetical protein
MYCPPALVRPRQWTASSRERLAGGHYRASTEGDPDASARSSEVPMSAQACRSTARKSTRHLPDGLGVWGGVSLGFGGERNGS